MKKKKRKKKEKKKKEIHRRILHIRISLGSKFKLQQF